MAKKSKQPSLNYCQSETTVQGPVECLGQTFPNEEARRAHFTDLLRKNLKAPAFRKIEGFPLGSDEDILALSDPPYYTACPNPFLEDFVRLYGRQYDSRSDSYAKQPFTADEWKLFLEFPSDKGPLCQVPFGHEDVRAYIDTFFLDGSLTPIEREDVTNLPAWAMTGVIHNPKFDGVRRYRALREKFESKIPAADVSHREWQQAAQRWAELVVLRWEWDAALDDGDRMAWSELHSKIEEAFGKWMTNRYGSLHNLPYQQQPVMVHQISRYIAFERNRKKFPKTALLVLDGLALDQWLLLKKKLEAGDKAWRFQESTAFAWVPTLTSVTRQSIFAGEAPLYFPGSFETTSKERTHWLRFWEDQDVQKNAVQLVTNINGADDSDLELAFTNPRLAVLGIVWNQIDNLVHNEIMKTAGLHHQVKLWASQGHLQLWLLEALLRSSAADEIEAQQLLRLPESFPFIISVGVSDLRNCEVFDIHRQGLDMDMVAVHKIRVSPILMPEDQPDPKLVSKSKPTLAPEPIPEDRLRANAEPSNDQTDKAVQPSLFAGLEKAAAKQAQHAESTHGRNAIWANTVRDHISEAIRLIRENGDRADAERLLVLALERMSAFSESQASFNPSGTVRPDIKVQGAVGSGQDSTPTIESPKSTEAVKKSTSKSKAVAATSLPPPSSAVIAELAGLKALSVRQPHAEAIMREMKTEDIRSTATKFRGRILIYASLGRGQASEEAGVMKDYGIDDVAVDDLPRGVLIGTVELHDSDGCKWHLRNPQRLEILVKPIKQPKPVWFNPF